MYLLVITIYYFYYHYFGVGSGELEFEEFVTLAAGFLTEDEPEDVEAMQAELKEAFRLYDKEGAIKIFNYYIVEIHFKILCHIRKWLHYHRCFERNT